MQRLWKVDNMSTGFLVGPGPRMDRAESAFVLNWEAGQA